MRSGSRTASLIKKPRPIADKIDNNAGTPRQQSAANIEPTTPTLSVCLSQKFFVTTLSLRTTGKFCRIFEARDSDDLERFGHRRIDVQHVDEIVDFGVETHRHRR